MSLDPFEGPWTERMMDRVQEDMVMMKNQERWPPGQGYLWLKTQPWITDRDSHVGHAHLNDPDNPTVLVMSMSGRVLDTRTYPSFLELAKYWSVD